MSSQIFRRELLQESNIERFAEELRLAFAGKPVNVKVTEFHGDYEVHENVMLTFDEYDEQSFNQKGVTVTLGGTGPRSMTNSHQVSLLLGNLAVHVETRYDPTFEWLHDEVVTIINRVGKDETFKTVSISAAPRP